jgi:hypothetical protein
VPVVLTWLSTEQLLELERNLRARLSRDELADQLIRSDFIVDAYKLLGDPILDSLQTRAYCKYRAWEAAPTACLRYSRSTRSMTSIAARP